MKTNLLCRAAMLLAPVALLGSGCAGPPQNPTPPASEADVLGEPVQLTSGEQFDRAGEAYFSPDMDWIVFQAAPKGEQHYQMYVAPLLKDAGGQITGLGAPTRVSPDGSRNTCGYFSPDGNSLIFASTAGRPHTDEQGGYQRSARDYRWVFEPGMDVFRADGWEPAVTAARDGAVDLAKHRLTDNDVYDAENAFSPDGKWVVFTSGRDKQDMDLYVMRADRTDVTKITNTPGYDGGPFFSPDGKSLVYRSDRKGNDLLQVYVGELAFDASGKITGLKSERQLTADANVNWGPYWHPDGKHVVYATSAHGHHNYELYLMRRDGTRKTRLTFRPGADVLPVFSPDGDYLMWSSKQRTPDGTTQVFIAPFTMPKGS